VFEPWQLALLFATGMAAGFVDSIAGGGGLISLPVLLSFGLDPKQALGTSKLQSSFGAGSAAWHYAQAGLVDLKDCARGFAITFAAAVAGTLTVQQLDPSFLRRFIPVLLIAVAAYMFLRPQVGVKDIHPRMRRPCFDILFGLSIGFYDGFFGPGTGTFWAVAFMWGVGFSLTRATACTKVMNFGSNIGSLIFFWVGGHVMVSAGLVMGLGQVLGARIGSRMVVKRGTKFIRPVFLSVVLAITAKLLYDAFRNGR
jgi:uncharacterized membrane protein YfcA